MAGFEVVATTTTLGGQFVTAAVSARGPAPRECDRDAIAPLAEIVSRFG